MENQNVKKLERERHTETGALLNNFLNDDDNVHMFSQEDMPQFLEAEVIDIMDLDGNHVAVVEADYELQLEEDHVQSVVGGEKDRESLQKKDNESGWEMGLDSIEIGDKEMTNLDPMNDGGEVGLEMDCSEGNEKGMRNEFVGEKGLVCLERGANGIEKECGGGKKNVDLERGAGEKECLNDGEKEIEKACGGVQENVILEGRNGEKECVDVGEKEMEMECEGQKKSECLEKGIGEKECLNVGENRMESKKKMTKGKIILEGLAGEKRIDILGEEQKIAKKKSLEKYFNSSPENEPLISPVTKPTLVCVNAAPSNDLVKPSRLDFLRSTTHSSTPNKNYNEGKDINAKQDNSRTKQQDKQKKVSKPTIDLAAWNNKLEKILNVNYQETYDFAGNAQIVHDEFARRVPKYMIRKKEDFVPSKSLSLKIECEKGRFVIRTNNEYAKFDLIMNCYGELQESSGTAIGKEMFVTSFNLVLNGKEKGYFWKYIKESCVPNCKFEEAFVKTEDDSSPLTYLCSLVAITDIKIGETLRVDSNHLRGLAPRDYDCSCDEEGCVKAITSQFRCGEPGCKDRGKAFSSAMAIKYHMNANHPKDKVKDKIPKQKLEKDIKCPVKKCNVKFTTNNALYRHLREIHETEQYKCPKCGKTFSRKDRFEIHRSKTCKGNFVDTDDKPILKKKPAIVKKEVKPPAKVKKEVKTPAKVRKELLTADKKLENRMKRERYKMIRLTRNAKEVKKEG